MHNLIGVEKGQGLSNVIVDVDLHVIGEAGLGQLQKVSERVVHQLHKENGQALLFVFFYAQILHNVWVADLAEKAALLLKQVVTIVAGRVDDGTMEEFGCAG